MYSSVAQPTEQQTLNLKVVGSTPTRWTVNRDFWSPIILLFFSLVVGLVGFLLLLVGYVYFGI